MKSFEQIFKEIAQPLVDAGLFTEEEVSKDLNEIFIKVKESKQ